MTVLRLAPGELPPAVVDAAIGWMVKLQSGQASPQDHLAWQRWQQERPEHAQAWADLDAFSRRLKAVPSALGHSTLAATRERPASTGRRTMLKSVALLAGTGTIGMGTAPDGGWRTLTAEHRTRVGERRRIALAQGSLLHLNTATAVDVRLDSEARCVSLHAGEVLVDCDEEHAASPSRPFVVRTAQGQVQAHHGRFVVRRLDERTAVQSLTASLNVQPHDAGSDSTAYRRLLPGKQLQFNADAVGPTSAADDGAGAWIDGLLVARDMRLDAMAAELARYRRGWLRCDPAVAALRISGVFPVDDLGRVVAALQRTLPVRAHMLTAWWITLTPS